MIVLQERGKVGLLKSAANASFELLLTPEGSPSPHDASRDQRTGAFCPCGHRGTCEDREESRKAVPRRDERSAGSSGARADQPERTEGATRRRSSKMIHPVGV